jgi:transposase InsO family protein
MRLAPKPAECGVDATRNELLEDQAAPPQTAPDRTGARDLKKPRRISRGSRSETLGSANTATRLLSPSLQTDLVSTTVRRAVEARRPDGDYCTIAIGAVSTRAKLIKRFSRRWESTVSMSRTGCCYDNAVMERFC